MVEDLAPGVARVLDAARAIARRHRHDSVEPAHLLAAVLRDAPGLFVAGVSRERLLGSLEALFARGARAALYRDSPTEGATLSPACRVLLRRVAAYGGHGGVDAVTPARVLDELWSEPSLAALVAEAGFDARSLDEIVEAARALAASRAHRRTGVDHVLAVLRRTAWFSGAVAAGGVDHARLDACLAARLAAEGRGGATPAPPLSDALAAIVERAAAVAASAGARSRGHDLAAQVLSDSREDALADADAPRLALLRWLACGRVDAGDDAVGSDAAELEVVLHDDALTTMEHVVSTLQSSFGCTWARATAITSAVTGGADTLVGRFPAADARARVARAREEAAAASMPLRISLRAPR